MKTKESVLATARRTRREIGQIFTDCASWNDNARQSGEQAIDPDPDGTLRRGAEVLDRLIAELSGGETMKALTVCQPYARRIALGLKPVENRTWSTKYRGPLVIHAGKSRDWLDERDPERYPGMPFGAVECVVDVVDCVPVMDLPEHLRGHEDANGPYCLVLANVRRLVTPVPCAGAQGLWTVPAQIVKQFRYVESRP